MDTLGLRGTVYFFVSAESVTGLDEENNEFAYFSVPLHVGSDGAVMVPSHEYLSAGNRCPSFRTLNPYRQAFNSMSKNFIGRIE